MESGLVKEIAKVMSQRPAMMFLDLRPRHFDDLRVAGKKDYTYHTGKEDLAKSIPAKPDGSLKSKPT